MRKILRGIGKAGFKFAWQLAVEIAATKILRCCFGIRQYVRNIPRAPHRLRVSRARAGVTATAEGNNVRIQALLQNFSGSLGAEIMQLYSLPGCEVNAADVIFADHLSAMKASFSRSDASGAAAQAQHIAFAVALGEAAEVTGKFLVGNFADFFIMVVSSLPGKNQVTACVKSPCQFRVWSLL